MRFTCALTQEKLRFLAPNVARGSDLSAAWRITKGYTPAQWVLGTNPTDEARILSDQFNPAVHQAALTEASYQ